MGTVLCGKKIMNYHKLTICRRLWPISKYYTSTRLQRLRKPPHIPYLWKNRHDNRSPPNIMSTSTLHSWWDLNTFSRSQITHQRNALYFHFILFILQPLHTPTARRDTHNINRTYLLNWPSIYTYITKDNTEKLASGGRYNIKNNIVSFYHFTTKIDELFKYIFIYFKYRQCK